MHRGTGTAAKTHICAVHHRFPTSNIQRSFSAFERIRMFESTGYTIVESCYFRSKLWGAYKSFSKKLDSTSTWLRPMGKVWVAAEWKSANLSRCWTTPSPHCWAMSCQHVRDFTENLMCGAWTATPDTHDGIGSKQDFWLMCWGPVMQFCCITSL